MIKSSSERVASGKRRGQHCAVLSALLAALSTAPALACPFCANMGKTLAQDVKDAGLVVYGTLSNAKLIASAKPGESDGSTDLAVLTVVKSHPIVEGKTKVTLPRFIPAAENENANYLIFAEVVQGRIDPYRGMPVESSEFVEYLVGSVRVAKAKPSEKLGFFFRYLDHKDVNISGDAYKEFADVPYRDVVSASKQYDPSKLVAWLRDKNTPSYRIGLYGLLLGACGRPEHAQVLREIVENRETRPLTGIDGLLGGYCVLDPRQGSEFVLTILTDPDQDFNARYAALRTVRFLVTELKNQVDGDLVFKQMARAILIPDISDLIIDEFRKHGNWQPVDPVLGLYGDPKFDLQVVRRAVIRYALKCPDPKAKAFISQLRARDPELVADVEEILKFEERQQVPISTGF